MSIDGEDVGLHTVHDHIDVKFIEKVPSTFEVTLTPCVEADHHLRLIRNVNSGRVKYLAVSTILIVIKKVRVAVQLNQLGNSIGRNGTGWAKGPILICRGVLVSW